MSKKQRRPSPEVPQVGNALEVPNYVIPTTDLGIGPERDLGPVETGLEDRREAYPGEDCLGSTRPDGREL